MFNRCLAVLYELKKHMVAVGTLLFLSIVADLFGSSLLLQKHQAKQDSAVRAELGALRARIEEKINTNMYLVYGMAAYIGTNPELSKAEFDLMASELLKQSSTLKNIAASPNFIFRYVYPLKGNEAILGVNYRDVPEQWQKALEAKETGKMVLAGPVNLIQGGRGLITRIPVVIPDSGEFWGLVSSVINLDLLFHQVGLSEKINLQLAIRGVDGLGASGAVFWGDEALFQEEQQAITVSVALPSGSWLMAATPLQGWATTAPTAIYLHMSVLLLFISLSFFSLIHLRDQKRVIASEMRLKAMSDATLDALIMTNAKDKVLFWNPAAAQLFGFSSQEAVGKRLHQLIMPKEQLLEFIRGMKKFSQTGKGPVINNVIEMQALHKDGRSLIVERTVSSFKLGGEWYAIGSVRDISERKKIEQKLIQMATIDDLTQLANRRHFFDLSETLLAQTKRYKHPFCLLMLDVDFFKKINDNYGHEAGDQLLRQLGQKANEILRECDTIGRVGGEEFMVAMPETTLAEGRKAAERLRVGLMKIKIRTDKGVTGFTVSQGLTQLTSEEDSLEALIKRADQALYLAKRNGRNRVEVQR